MVIFNLLQLASTAIHFYSALELAFITRADGSADLTSGSAWSAAAAAERLAAVTLRFGALRQLAETLAASTSVSARLLLSTCGALAAVVLYS